MGLARQEFAEDEESCFRASGDCVFETDAIEVRFATAPDPIERRRNGQMEIWLPPVAGRQYLLAVDPAGGGCDGDYSGPLKSLIWRSGSAVRGVRWACRRPGTCANCWWVT